MTLLGGAAVKIVDSDGVYLGVLMVPSGIAERLNDTKYGIVRVFRQPLVLMSAWMPTDYAREVEQAEFFLLVPYYRGSFMLEGALLEDISNDPGFAFLPSAEYVRRSIAGVKAEEAKPVEPGPHLVAAREVS